MKKGENKMILENVKKDMEENKIKDSGERTEFDSGAVRDIQKGKGRCDLLPLDIITYLYDSPATIIFHYINDFIQTGDETHLIDLLKNREYTNILGFNGTPSMLLELAKHYEQGAEKYSENNWKKGIPVSSYIDSAIRHYLKYLADFIDEPHNRAFVWNIVGAIWTCIHLPELNTYQKEHLKEMTPDDSTNTTE